MVVEPATSSLLPGLCTVVAEAGSITSVGATSPLDELTPTVEVDLDGKYICPCVSICHNPTLARLEVTIGASSIVMSTSLRPRDRSLWLT